MVGGQTPISKARTVEPGGQTLAQIASRLRL